MKLIAHYSTTALLIGSVMVNAACGEDPNDSENPGTGTGSCDGGITPPPPPPPDPTDALACDQFSSPLLPQMSDGAILTYGQLRTLCCYLPEHFPRITMGSTNPANVAQMESLLAQAPNINDVRDSLSFCQPSILALPASDLSGTSVGAAKTEIWDAEQAAIEGTPLDSILGGVPLDQVVHIDDATSVISESGGPGGSGGVTPPASPRLIHDPSAPIVDEFGPTAENPAYISVALSAIYYGFQIFRSLQLMGSGPLPGEMPTPAMGAMAPLNALNIMAIEPAPAAQAAGLAFLQVVGESCKASRPGEHDGNSSLYSRCWGVVGTTTYSWNAGNDFRYDCQKEVTPNAGVFNGQNVAIWFTRQLTPTIYNYWKRSTAQAWPGAKVYNLLPDVVDWGNAARRERGVNAAFRYEWNCVGWLQQPTYTYLSWATAWKGQSGYTKAQ